MFLITGAVQSVNLIHTGLSEEISLERENCHCAPGARGPRIPTSALNPVRTCPFQTKDRLRR